MKVLYSSDSIEPASQTMTAVQFRSWRKSLGLKQREAAECLGLKKRIIQYYEKGERDGRKLIIPKNIRLACYAISKGIEDFDGEIVVKFTSDTAANERLMDRSAANSSGKPQPGGQSTPHAE